MTYISWVIVLTLLALLNFIVGNLPGVGDFAYVNFAVAVVDLLVAVWCYRLSLEEGNR